MGLNRVALRDLTIEDERSFAHVSLYDELKRWMLRRDVRFAVMTGRSDHALVLNLAFWRPGDVAEVLRDDVITADQLAHNAWHALAADALGDGARSVAGLLLAEAIASAFDIYLVGRLVGHASESEFLRTQVPAMAEAALEAEVEESVFEALVEAATREPEKSFESLRQLLFDAARGLAGCGDIDEAAGVLAGFDGHPMSPLLHHYELSTWVLFARRYGEGDESAALAVDVELRGATDSVAWLEARWLGGGDGAS